MKKVYNVTAKAREEHYLIPESDGPNLKKVNCIRFFRCKKIMYIWDSDVGAFSDLKMMDNNVPINHYHGQDGLSKEEQHTRFVDI